ncbi:hypothetical protein D3C85_1467710 [compost metagenome]
MVAGELMAGPWSGRGGKGERLAGAIGADASLVFKELAAGLVILFQENGLEHGGGGGEGLALAADDGVVRLDVKPFPGDRQHGEPPGLDVIGDQVPGAQA